MDRNRFLEWTSQPIEDQLKPLTKNAMEFIRSWPCLLMQEGRGQERVYLVRISMIEDTGQEVKFSYKPFSSDAPILENHELWKLRDSLDIGKFEFNRNHWAVKDRDLFEVLSSAGHSINPSFQSLFARLPLPTPKRSAILQARDYLAELSNTELDDFLLEAGVDELHAGREVGSRRDRANAIAKFALERPSAITAENEMLSVFMVWESKVQRGPGAAPGPSSEKALVAKAEVQASPANVEASGRSPSGVFVVHGRNEEAREGVVAFLEAVGLEGIVLHDQPNMGRHLLTKFIDEAQFVAFAVVLMTADDIGGLDTEDLQPRARQNVILELGYFIAHLGQEKVCALVSPGLEAPSDFDGIVYIEMDEEGEWRGELERELVAAKMPLTPNRVL